MIDLTKKYQTRDGQKVRLYCVDANGDYCVHGSMKDCHGGWGSPVTWTEDGYCWQSKEEHPMDLVEIQPAGWVNIYNVELFINRSAAETAARFDVRKRFACVHVREGDGLTPVLVGQ